MKYMSTSLLLIVKPSPPSRGAWIEIVALVSGMTEIEVAPLAGGVD